MAYTIVTPYFREPPELLRRCLASVRAQTVAADHIVVADGAPQDWIDEEGVRHIRLDRTYADFGDTPRAVGALLAVSAGSKGIGFLDADNWLEPDHIATCLETAGRAPGADYVIARRALRRPDGSRLPVDDEPSEVHVDTNCFFLLPGSFHLAPHFGLIPRELAVVCDRVFYDTLRRRGMRSAENEATTVNYHCLWSAIYESIGETPPPGAKPNPPWDEINAWVAGRSPDEQAAVERLCGSRP